MMILFILELLILEYETSSLLLFLLLLFLNFGDYISKCLQPLDFSYFFKLFQELIIWCFLSLFNSGPISIFQ